MPAHKPLTDRTRVMQGHSERRMNKEREHIKEHQPNRKEKVETVRHFCKAKWLIDKR